MSYKFEDAEPVKVAGTGRQAEPNPFTEIVAAIALKTNPSTQKPVAKSFIETHEAGDDKRTTAINRIKRFTSEAGEKNDPPVTVRVHAEPIDAKSTRVTIWTVKRQQRPKNDKPVETQTASTPQSNAVAAPNVASGNKK